MRVITVDSRGAALTSVMARNVVDNNTDNSKSHSICFLPQYRRQRKCFFFSARELKKALRGTLTRD